jgi:hypothetical protein
MFVFMSWCCIGIGNSPIAFRRATNGIAMRATMGGKLYFVDAQGCIYIYIYIYIFGLSHFWVLAQAIMAQGILAQAIVARGIVAQAVLAWACWLDGLSWLGLGFGLGGLVANLILAWWIGLAWLGSAWRGLAFVAQVGFVFRFGALGSFPLRLQNAPRI